MLYSPVFEIYPLQQLRMSELGGPDIWPRETIVC